MRNSKTQPEWKQRPLISYPCLLRKRPGPNHSLTTIGLPLHEWQTRRVWTPLSRVSRRRRRCFVFPAPVVSHATHQGKSILRVWFTSERTELTTHRVFAACRRIYRVPEGVPPPARVERRKNRQRKATRATGWKEGRGAAAKAVQTMNGYYRVTNSLFFIFPWLILKWTGRWYVKKNEYIYI
jgi:hypothetical protein